MSHMLLRVAGMMKKTPPAPVTWNSADKSALMTLSNGNLRATSAAATGTTVGVRATVGKSTGKWYWEFKPVSLNGEQAMHLGLADAGWTLAVRLGSVTVSAGWDNIGIGAYNGVEFGPGAPGAYGVGTVIGVALDCDADTAAFYISNVLRGTATGIAGTIFPAVDIQYNADAVDVNFGATTFTYTPPAGFNAYNS